MKYRNAHKKRLKTTFKTVAAAFSLGIGISFLEQMPKDPASDTQQITTYSAGDGSMQGYNLSPRDQMWKQTLRLRSAQSLKDELFLAASTGDSWRIRSLYAHTKYDLTTSADALKIASVHGHFDVVQAILNAAPQSARTGAGLFDAIHCDHISIARYLVEQGKVERERLTEGLYASIFKNNLTLFRYLLSKGADPGRDESLALRLAVAKGNSEMVSVLLKQGKTMPAAPSIPYAFNADGLEQDRHDDFGWGFGQHPWSRFYPEGTNRFYFQPAVNVNANNGSALVVAVENGDLDIAKQLITAGADVRLGQDQALLQAVKGGNLAACEILLQNGADPFARNGEIITAAIHAENSDILMTLVSAVFNFNPKVQNSFLQPGF